MKKRKLWYIGVSVDKYTAFLSAETPTQGRFRDRYLAVIGPFVTLKGVRWAEKYGRFNPHFTCVADAEQLANYP